MSARIHRKKESEASRSVPDRATAVHAVGMQERALASRSDSECAPAIAYDTSPERRRGVCVSEWVGTGMNAGGTERGGARSKCKPEEMKLMEMPME